MRILLLAVVLLSFCNAGCGRQVTAQSWLVSNTQGQIIRSENIDQIRSIASITKLITVMTVLDAKQNMDETLPLVKSTKSHLPKKNSLTRRQLIDLAMVKSDNRAAQTLCENYPGGLNSCIQAMNQKLQELGMVNSVVHDPTGLDARNVSTARELVMLVHAARTYGPVVEASQKSRIEIKIKKKWVFFTNTNPLVGKTHRVIISKTGWITASGGCLVMLIDTDVGDRIVVVLGSKNTHTRIPEAEFISEMKEQDEVY